MRIVMVAAVADNWVIGHRGELPWRLPADLARFKRVTMGHQCIMGRKTFETLPGPLPGRRTIVVTRQEDYHAPGITAARSLQEALAIAAAAEDWPREQVDVLGGGEIYAQALGIADVLDLTRVSASPAGDAHFPRVEFSDWELASREAHAADARNSHAYAFERWVRRAGTRL